MVDRLTIASSALSRRSFLRGSALVLGAAGTGLMLASCAPESTPPTTPGGDEVLTQRHMTPSAFSSSFIEVMVAAEKGYYAEFNLDIELQQAGASPLPAMAALAQGDLEYGRETGTGAILSMVGRDLPLRGIATIRQRSQWELVSLPSAGIDTPAKLEGKTLGIVAAGGITESFAIMMLQNYGVDPDTVSRPVVGLGQAGLEHANKGEVDAWISLDSHRTAIQRGGTEVRHNAVDEFLTVPSDTYMVTQEMVDSGSDAPARFLAAIRKAVDFTRQESNWAEVATILQKYNKDVKTDSVLADLPLVISQWMDKGEDQLLELHPADWEEGQKQLLRAGMIEKTKPVSDLLYDGYLAKAKELAGV